LSTSLQSTNSKPRSGTKTSEPEIERKFSGPVYDGFHVHADDKKCSTSGLNAQIEVNVGA